MKHKIDSNYQRTLMRTEKRPIQSISTITGNLCAKLALHYHGELQVV